MSQNNRMDYLDGLRGLAIGFVILFHYYCLLPTNVKTSSGLKFFIDYIPIKYGYLGVMLFFSISGFVISQTLYRSKSPFDFSKKRFARLFPTMLLCSILTFCFSFVEPRIYYSTFNNFLPSLTFISPEIFNLIFKGEFFEWMDGAYWSLFTELRFYILIAVIFFYNRSNFFINFLIMSVFIETLFLCSINADIKPLTRALDFFLIANQLPWFVFGIAGYYLHLGENKKATLLFAVSLLSLTVWIFSIQKHPYLVVNTKATVIGIISIFTLFLSAIKVNFIKKLLSFKPLALAGLSSYSLYLLHQNIGCKIILILDHLTLLPNGISYLYPLIPLFLLTIVSTFIYKYYENPCNERLRKLFNSKLKLVGTEQLSG